jgi:hypothetical protein
MRKCLAEVEVYTERVFVRLTFSDEGGSVLAGALTLLPSTWEWLRGFLARETELTLYGVEEKDETEIESNRPGFDDVQFNAARRGGGAVQKDWGGYCGEAEADPPEDQENEWAG